MTPIKLIVSAVLGILLLPFIFVMAVFYGILSGVMNPVKTRSDV
jgi:hypothetical protein